METKLKQNISKEEIANLPLKHFDGEIIVINTLQQVKQTCIELSNEKLIGFDTETRPSFKKGIKNPYKVALLQLATDKKAYLFRLNNIGLPKEITDIFENKHITKVGLAIKDDINVLKKYRDFNEERFIDLAPYSSEKFNIECNSLRKLTAIILKFRISKSQQLSNWENQSLSTAQQTYAATDAWVCYKIFEKLHSIK